MPEFGESSYRRFLQGDKIALEEMIRTYSDSLVRFAYCYVKDASAAEDIMEDTFAALFMKAPRLSDETHLRRYLFKIARNKALDRLRRYRQEVPLCDVENVLSDGDLQGDALQRQRDETVYICLQKLPRQYREVLELIYFEDFSTEEVCRIMGKGTKQIYNLHTRAKIALKELLQKEGISHEDIS